MNKGAQRGKNQSGPGSAGHGRTRQAARRERPPAGLPPQALCLRWRRQRGAGAPPSAARLHRPAARAQEESRAPAASTRPRSPPGREACALLPPGPPGPRGCHTHLAGAGAGGRHLRGWWGGRGDASEGADEEAGRGGRGGRHPAGTAQTCFSPARGAEAASGSCPTWRRHRLRASPVSGTNTRLAFWAAVPGPEPWDSAACTPHGGPRLRLLLGPLGSRRGRSARKERGGPESP